eukprot:COSAG01_NODE_231_length_21019_cov_104.980501_24_plen_44_part_00
MILKGAQVRINVTIKMQVSKHQSGHVPQKGKGGREGDGPGCAH